MTKLSNVTCTRVLKGRERDWGVGVAILEKRGERKF